MTIQLNEADRDELVALFEEHKRIALAMTKMDDPKWVATIGLTTEEDVERGEDTYIELSFSKSVILEVLTDRYNTVAELLRDRGVVLHMKPAEKN